MYSLPCPLKRRTPRTPNTRSAAKRTGRTPPASGVSVIATGAEEDEDDAGLGSDASVAEGPHANAWALSKIREALKGLSQEDLQSLAAAVTAGTRIPSLASETTPVMARRMPVRALRTALHTSPLVPRGGTRSPSSGGRASKYAAFRSLCAGQPV